MALEFSPNGRGILVLGAIALTLLIWTQTSGSWYTLGLLALVIGTLVFLAWGGGTRLARWVAGVR